MRNAENTREFVVWRVSSNTNSFGLWCMIVMDRDGETWDILANDLNKRKIGDVLSPDYLHAPIWSALGFECSHRLLPDAPEEVIKHVWKNAVTAVPA